jgi:hypothetical protein
MKDTYQQHCAGLRHWDKIVRFVAQRSGTSDAKVRAVPLAGGVESAGAFRLTMTWREASGQPCSDSFAIKCLVDSGTRELMIYEALAATPMAASMPRLVGAERRFPPEPLDQDFSQRRSAVRHTPARELRAITGVFRIRMAHQEQCRSAVHNSI